LIKILRKIHHQSGMGAVAWIGVGLLVGVLAWSQLSWGDLPVVGAQESPQERPLAGESLWRAVSNDEVLIAREAVQAGPASGDPAMRRLLRLDPLQLVQLLEGVPREAFRVAEESLSRELPLPLPDGRFLSFRIEESPILEPVLAARYPEIRTFIGQSLTSPGVTMRGDLTPQGFHATILLLEGAVTIQPFVGGGEENLYLTYSGMPPELSEEELASIGCDLPEGAADLLTREQEWERSSVLLPQFQVGGTLRTFRIALAVSWEYAQAYGGGTNAGTIASLVTWLNGVNAIYERELAIRFQLIDEPSILFTTERGFTASSDPFANGNTLTMLNQMGAVIASISTATYDIGHVLGTGGGGVAYLGVACNNSGVGGGPAKGLGVTLVSGQVGNPAGIKVLAHEIGHQFGAYHSFNGTTGNCNASNRTPNSAYESGAGLTLMSYAGLCASDNITPPQQVDLRFHAKSLQQILALVEGRARCARLSSTGNSAPTVQAGRTYTIPRQTPFQLSAIAGDPDPEDTSRLTYTWEQVDAGGSLYGNPSYFDTEDPITTTRPIFRPFPPSAIPSRIFPQLHHILQSANEPPETVSGLRTAESLPQVSRALQFGVTVRDNRVGGGGVAYDVVQLTVAGEAGPFRVVSPSTPLVWTGGSRQVVTWQVANTHRSPVSCPQVRLRLSLDGGETFPIVLHPGTPNDGSETITVPSGWATSQARVLVEAVGNIFFDISDVNFSLLPGTAAAQPVLNQVVWSPTAPQPGQPLEVNLSGSGFIPNETQVWVCQSGSALCTNQPQERITVVSSTQLVLRNLVLTAGSWELYVQTPLGNTNRSLPLELRSSSPSNPTLTRVVWSPLTPTANRAFSGQITGTNFVSEGTRVYFCLNGTNRCSLHPAQEMVVVDTTLIRLTSVMLESGTWQVIVETYAGSTSRSTAFTVIEETQPLPTLSGASWTPSTPIANQAFSGILSGNHLTIGTTRVFFCPAGSTDCLEHSASGVSVVGTSSVSLTGILLPSGNWQAYVQTPAGNSNRTTVVTVAAPPPSTPTVTQAVWSPASPQALEPFQGTITGTNFALGTTRLLLCRVGTEECQPQSIRNVQVVSATRLQVSGIRLEAGEWQAQVQVSASLSNRSTPFRVRGNVSQPPGIDTFLLTPSAPRANQSFVGRVTGSGFVAGQTQVLFCQAGGETCSLQLATVQTANQLEVGPITLASGQWQVQVETPAGRSVRTSPFEILPPLPPPPTLSTFTPSLSSPVANRPFQGVLRGTGFVVGGTEVLFCRSESSECLVQPPGTITATTIQLEQVVLPAGRWQGQVRTAGGTSNRTSTFVVVAPSPEELPPTITGYSWTPDRPLANLPFAGIITGGGFVAGSTQVLICEAGTEACIPHSLEQTTVVNAGQLQVTQLLLPLGSWELLVKTSRGQSGRSSPFLVTEAPSLPPVISTYLWRPSTPRASTPFDGVIIGSHFELGSTRVFFCANLTNNCTEVPAEKIVVNSPTSLTLTNLLLLRGSWQVYLETSTSRSNRSRSFLVM